MPLLRVVCIDDEPAICAMFKENFESDNVVVETFCDPKEAVAAITANPPDLVFLDFRMQGCTGADVARKLDPALPKVLITGDITAMSDDVFVKVFYKPYNFDEVGFFIQTYVDKL